jgi:WS/DGAT/MGAT family acyltransferase
MHVGATQVFEAGPLRRTDGGVDVERIEEYVASRLHHLPRYRQRLAWTPLEGRPIWIDDARFNLRYHLRHTRLPRPGDERLLKRTAGRILSQHLDRGKPLWELWVIEGLEGERFAIVSKVHHCMIDGVSGADLLSVLLTPEPLEKVEPPPAWVSRPPPDGVRLVLDRAVGALRAPLDAAGAAWRVVRDEDGARERLGARLAAIGRLAPSALAPAAPTSLNQPIGPYRRVDWLPMELGRVRHVAERLGGTVNDVVLATVAGGVSRFLRRSRGEDVGGLDFRVMAPVSLRSATERGRLGNRVSTWFVSLPLDERDPRRRFERVRAATAELKRSRAALAGEALVELSEWTGSGVLSLMSRLVHRGQQPFHMVVTNVPGPRQTLHLLGSPMLAAHPIVPLLGHLALGIALFSYRDVLSWGFTADWDLVPDLHDLVRAVEHAFQRLADAAERAA